MAKVLHQWLKQAHRACHRHSGVTHAFHSFARQQGFRLHPAGRPSLSFLNEPIKSDGPAFSAWNKVYLKRIKEHFRRFHAPRRPASGKPHFSNSEWHRRQHRRHYVRWPIRLFARRRASLLKGRVFLNHKRTRWVDCERYQSNLVDHSGVLRRSIPAQLFLPRVQIAQSQTNSVLSTRAPVAPTLPLSIKARPHAYLAPFVASHQGLGALRCLSTVTLGPCPKVKVRSLLSAVTVVARVFLSLFPIALRARFMHLRYATPASFFNSRAFLLSLFALPVGLVAAILAAYSQEVPLTGRKRVLLLDQDEQADIVQAFAAGRPLDRPLPSHIQWYHILRNVLQESDREPGTLFGGRILLQDWRERWVTGTLRLLEHGLAGVGAPLRIDNLAAPAAKSNLSFLPAADLYSVLLIDRPEQNAFAFGWAPDTQMPHGLSKGVICIFSGFLDHILAQQPAPGMSREALAQEQSKQLAVLLAHELSHLVLGHTMEAYANSVLLWPYLQRMAVDGLRTLFYPVTSILGPFVGDSIFMSSALLSQPAVEGSHPCRLDLCAACESRSMEFEADSASLRLLASAGIDPREAIRFWQRRLDSQCPAQASSTAAGAVQDAFSRLRMHSPQQQSSYFPSHPVDESRLARIKRELNSWVQPAQGLQSLLPLWG